MERKELDAVGAIFQSLDREVWIVTAKSGAQRGGLTATWVSQASLDREHPTVVVGLAPNHHTYELVRDSGVFGLHLVRGDQAPLALSFAIGSGRDRDKLAGLRLDDSSVTGSPLLLDCLAWLDCRVFAHFEMGDRVYVWADVVAGKQMSQGAALREHALVAAASQDELQQLKQNMEDDIAVQRVQQAAWRKAQVSAD